MDTMVLLIDYSVVIIVHWNVGIRLIKKGGGLEGKEKGVHWRNWIPRSFTEPEPSEATADSLSQDSYVIVHISTQTLRLGASRITSCHLNSTT